MGVTHCRKWPPAGIYVRDAARKELQGHPMCQKGTGWGANGWSWEGCWLQSGRQRPHQPGRRVTAQGPVLPGWVVQEGLFGSVWGTEDARHPGSPAHAPGNERGWQEAESLVYTASSWASPKILAGNSLFCGKAENEEKLLFQGEWG